MVYSDGYFAHNTTELHHFRDDGVLRFIDWGHHTVVVLVLPQCVRSAEEKAHLTNHWLAHDRVVSGKWKKGTDISKE